MWFVGHVLSKSMTSLERVADGGALVFGLHAGNLLAKNYSSRAKNGMGTITRGVSSIQHRPLRHSCVLMSIQQRVFEIVRVISVGDVDVQLASKADELASSGIGDDSDA